MRIKWENIFAVGLVVFGLYVVLKLLEPISAFLAGINDIGREGATGHEQVRGAMAAVFIGILLIGVLRVLHNNRR